MLTLRQSLQVHDLGYLRIVAELWGLELSAQNFKAAVQQLSGEMLDASLLEEIIEALPEDARKALDDLLADQGSLPWPQFTRRYGDVREMGPGRRDRECPYLEPVSPAEVLWYRGLIARNFFDSATGPQEYAFIPSDLLDILPQESKAQVHVLGRPASPSERAHHIPANDHILDHACTLLAALRLDFSAEKLAQIESEWRESYAPAPYPLSIAALQVLLSEVGLFDVQGIPRPEPTREFLETPRPQALAKLAHTWLQSETINDLRCIPGLVFEGEWHNDPLLARQIILNHLKELPAGSWWSLTAFIAAIKETLPDFQRPAGDYDSWYIREASTDQYLRGFEHWEAVDGALVHFLISGPFHWLGITELASSTPNTPPTAFRFSAWAPDLLEGLPPENMAEETSQLILSSDAQIHAPRLVPRSVRYQIARFCAWEGMRVDVYFYRIQPASLELARQQGLRISHLLSLLHRHAPTAPPSLVKALDRWDKFGTEARLEQALILRLRTPEMLQALQSSRAARFLGDPLGPTVIIVKPGSYEKVLAILAELGYLGEAITEF